MQRLLSRHCFRSSAVSLPSLPSLLVRSGLLEPEEYRLLVVLDEPAAVGLEVLPDLDELPPESEDLAGEGVD